jgi:hypothetical protein
VTDQNLEMSFNLINNDTQWKNFRLNARFRGWSPECDFVLDFENPGPGDVINNDFSGWLHLGTKGAYFSFDGQLASSSTASGTYVIDGNAVNRDNCGNIIGFGRSGTWSASR